MNFLKLCVSFLILITYVVVSANDKPNFCGYSPSYEELYYPIVNQQIISDPSLYPFLHCPWESFCGDYQDTGGVTENLEEWKNFFGNDVSTENRYKLIYKSSLLWYEKLLKKEDGETIDKLASNIPNKLKKDFANYMILAKQCESIRSNHDNGNGWYQGEGRDGTDKKPKLLVLALANYKATKNTFLKNRYGYQIVRLSHYLQENEAAERYFKSMLQDTPSTSYIYHLALEQKSGAAFNLQKMQEATLGYLQVYTNVPSRRRMCALSLKHIDWSNPQVPTTISSEENYAEILYFFKAFYANGDVAIEMKNLEKLKPNSPYLEVLAIREIDKLETDVFNNGYYDWNDPYAEETENKVKDFDTPILQSIQQLAKRQIENEKVTNTDFWKIVLASTYLKNNDYENGLKVVNQVSNNSQMYAQAKQLILAIEVLKLKKVNRVTIEDLYNRLKNDKDLYSYYPVTAFFFNKIAEVYKKNGNIVIGTFGLMEYYGPLENVTWQAVEEKLGVNYNLNFKGDFVEEKAVNSLQDFIDIPTKNGYEKLILSKMKDNPQDYAYDLKGTWLFQQNRLKEAIATFKKVKSPDNYWQKNIRPELFSGAIREYFDTPFERQSDKIHLKYKSFFDKQGVKFTKQDKNYTDNKLLLAAVLQQLEKQAKADPKNASDYYYMLGNAWYNMSEEGWFLNTLYYIGNNERNHILGYNYFTKKSSVNKSAITQNATQYFEKAVNAQGNRETKAKATFMLAKTNYCVNYTNGVDYRNRVEVCGEHLDYFKKLQNEYSDTQFEKQVLKECSWYRVFTQN